MDRGHRFTAIIPRKRQHAHSERILYGYVEIYSQWMSYELCCADFELGLELDGAEVRGILLYEEREWGRVVFDMLS